MGQCHALALVISENTGWGLAGEVWYEPGYRHVHDDRRRIADHVYVVTPCGNKLDIEGLQPQWASAFSLSRDEIDEYQDAHVWEGNVAYAEPRLDGHTQVRAADLIEFYHLTADHDSN